MAEIRAYMTGDIAVQRMFMELPKATQDRIVAPLIRQGGKMLANAVKAAAPKESGLMQQAIGATDTKKYSGGTIFLTAGVRRGFRRAVTAGKGGKLRVRSRAFTKSNPDESVRNPTKYLHLVTGGRKSITATRKRVLYSSQTNRFFGKSVRSVAPNPFIARAFAGAKEQVAGSILSQAPAMIEAEAAKIGR